MKNIDPGHPSTLLDAGFDQVFLSPLIPDAQSAPPPPPPLLPPASTLSRPSLPPSGMLVLLVNLLLISNAPPCIFAAYQDKLSATVAALDVEAEAERPEGVPPAGT